MVTMTGLGVSQPQTVSQRELWDGFFAEHYAGVQRALAQRIFANSGVRQRHAAISPLLEDVTRWSTERRMRRYIAEAMPLGKAAVSDALADAGLAAGDIGLFAVCSCTGYVTPGLDILLARDLGMSASTKRVFIGHMGCYAALPGLELISDFATARKEPAALLCVELTSLHVQPPSADADQIVSHALFADAAAAVVVTPSAAPGYAIRDIVSVTDVSTADHMTWDVTDLGFRMGLSPRVPDVLAANVTGLVDKLCERNRVARADVDGWAVHPGGPRILDVVGKELDLPDGALATSRAVLAEHGNCSSPTVLMILDAMLRRAAAPETVVALAFGPGLTLYAALLTRN